MPGLALYCFTYGEILPKDTALIAFHRRSNEFLGRPLTELLDGAEEEVLFVGTNIRITASDAKPKVLELLQRGVKVRFLVLDPTCGSLGSVAADFDVPVSELRDECD